MPSSLALAARGGRAITMSVPQYRYARAAIRYGPYAARAAGRIARWAYKRYRGRRRSGFQKAKRARFSRARIGERVGSSSTKQTIQTAAGFEPYASRTLHTRSLMSITKGDLRNQRERNIVNLRGFKICLYFRNQTNNPMYLNVAVIVPKNATVPSTTNFFRSNASERGRDFDSASMTALDFHCYNINTDNYHILRHKRYQLTKNGQTNTAHAEHSSRNYITIDWWIKLQRQIRWDGDTSGPINDHAYLAYWCDEMGLNQGAPPNATAIGTQFRTIVYFREPRDR